MSGHRCPQINKTSWLICSKPTTGWKLEQICKRAHQFGPEPGQRAVDLRPPQLFVGLVTPADAQRSDCGGRLRRHFLGLPCRPEGTDQSVLNVLQDHGGQSVLTTAVSVHAVRLSVASWKLSQRFSRSVWLHSGRCPPSPWIRRSWSSSHPCLLPNSPCFVIVTMENLPFARMLYLLLLLPPASFDYVNKNSGRSRTKTIVESEKNWKEPSPPPFPQPSQSQPLLFLLLPVSPAPAQVWETSCEWVLI